MASAIIVVVIFVLLALAILFICQNGGWQGGCGGNCASCHHGEHFLCVCIIYWPAMDSSL